jgi:hypothetical protein
MDSVAGRFEEDPGLRDALQAERRALAAFSSEMAVVRVGRSELAIWDMLGKGQRSGGGVGKWKHLRRLAACKDLTRPIAAIMETLLRPAVSRRRRSWTSF